MAKKVVKFLKLFVPIFLVCTFTFGTILAAVQQNYRQSANDPQIQMAEDQAKVFEKGQKIESIDTSVKIDLSQSLAPFLIIFDSQGNPATSSAILNGRIPVPPPGVFEQATSKGENRVTWQPSADVRIAAVIVPFHGQTSGFVLAGRSLREVEKREYLLNQQVLVGYLVSVFVIGAKILILP